jgi:hypothetical protein
MVFALAGDSTSTRFMETFDSALFFRDQGARYGSRAAGNMGNAPPPVKLLPGENKAVAASRGRTE